MRVEYSTETQRLMEEDAKRANEANLREIEALLASSTLSDHILASAEQAEMNGWHALASQLHELMAATQSREERVL